MEAIFVFALALVCALEVGHVHGGKCEEYAEKVKAVEMPKCMNKYLALANGLNEIREETAGESFDVIMSAAWSKIKNECGDMSDEDIKNSVKEILLKVANFEEEEAEEVKDAVDRLFGMSSEEWKEIGERIKADCDDPNMKTIMADFLEQLEKISKTALEPVKEAFDNFLKMASEDRFSTIRNAILDIVNFLKSDKVKSLGVEVFGMDRACMDKWNKAVEDSAGPYPEKECIDTYAGMINSIFPQ